MYVPSWLEYVKVFGGRKWKMEILDEVHYAQCTYTFEIAICNDTVIY